MIVDWKSKIRGRQRAHLYFAESCGRYHYAIGVPATICTAVAGSALLAEVSDPRIRIAVGVIGIVAAVLTAVQTFYSHAKQAEKHRAAAAEFGRIRRDIEIFERFPPQRNEDKEKRVREISEAMSKADLESPLVRFIKDARALARISPPLSALGMPPDGD